MQQGVLWSTMHGPVLLQQHPGPWTTSLFVDRAFMLCSLFEMAPTNLALGENVVQLSYNLVLKV